MTKKNGFTLVELLVVIAIIGVLIALLLPAVQAAREAARRASCNNNLKQIALGLHNHHDVNGKFPQGIYTNSGSASGGAWSAFILPYIEQENLFERITFDNEGANWGASGGISGATLDSTDATHRNVAALELHLDAFFCPSAPIQDHVEDQSTDRWTVLNRAPATYLGCASGTRVDDSGDFRNLDGVFYTESTSNFASITDGSSNTVLVGEALPLITADFANYESGDRKDHWIIGGDDSDVLRDHSEHLGSTGVPVNSTEELAFSSAHPTGCLMGLADGSVRFISENIDFDTLRNLGSRNDGNVLELP